MNDADLLELNLLTNINFIERVGATMLGSKINLRHLNLSV